MPATAPTHHHHHHAMLSPYYLQHPHVLPHSHHPPHYDALPPTHYREEDEYNDDCYDPEMNNDADTTTYRSVKRRRRLTQDETRILNRVFEDTTKPNSQMRKKLAAQLSMTPRAIQIWFQNRRAKMKRDAIEISGNSASPSTSSSSSSSAKKPATTSSVNESPSIVTSVKVESNTKSDRATPPRLDLSSTSLRRKSSTTSNSSRSSSSSYDSGSPSLSPLSATTDDLEHSSVYSTTPSIESFPSPPSECSNYLLSQMANSAMRSPTPSSTTDFAMMIPAAAYSIDYSSMPTTFAPDTTALLSHRAQYAQDSNQVSVGLGLLPTEMPLPYQSYPVQPQLDASSFYSPPPYALESSTPTDVTPFDISTDFAPYFTLYRPRAEVDIAMFGIGMCGDEYGRGWGFGKMEGCGFDFLGAKGEVMGSL